MEKINSAPVGVLKGKASINCSICSDTYIRRSKVNIYTGSNEEIEQAKQILSDRMNKKYTCKVCKSIIKD